MVYEMEKTLEEQKEQITDEERAAVEPKVEALKEALKTDDAEAIKTATEELTTAFQPIAQKMYQQTQAEEAAGQPGPEQAEGEEVVDADYEVVDED